jgi:hypothetical protein
LYENTSNDLLPLAESWNGTSWTIQRVPSPPGSNTIVLNGVSCTSPSACTAVGEYDTSKGAQPGLAERWNGTSWTVQATPAGTDVLDDVSCGTPTTCTAVGDTYTFEHVGTLASNLSTVTWQLYETPLFSSFL